MIDYATLCRAIDDWKAGQKPSGVILAAPQRVPTRPAAEEEAVVEYSAAYDIGEPEPAETPDSTVIYQLDGEGEGEGEVEAADADADSDADAEVESDETDVDADVESDDDYQR